MGFGIIHFFRPASCFAAIDCKSRLAPYAGGKPLQSFKEGQRSAARSSAVAGGAVLVTRKSERLMR